MALPAEFGTVTLAGKYTDLSGSPASGTVTFTAPTVLTAATSNVLVVPKPFVVTLDGTGSFSVVLPATDDPDISPSFTYHVKEVFTSAGLNVTGREYDINIPFGTVGTLQIADIAPVAPALGGVAYVTSAAMLDAIADALDAEEGISDATYASIALAQSRYAPWIQAAGVYPTRPAGNVIAIGDAKPSSGFVDGLDLWIDTTPTLVSYVKRKVADGAAINSGNTGSTATADANLSGFAIAANEVVDFVLSIRYTVPDATMGLKWGITAPTGASVLMGKFQQAGTADTSSINWLEATPNNVAGSTAFGATAGGTYWMQAQGTIFNGSTAGTITVTCAQGVAEAGDLVVKKGSRLRIERLI